MSAPKLADAMHRAAAMRKPLRLPHFDYSSSGAYFVTIAIHRRAHLLGSLTETAEFELSAAGKMIEDWWAKLPHKFPKVTLDAHGAMPDHFHGIVLIDTNDTIESEPAASLSRVIQWFKTMSTAEYMRRVATDGWQRFDKRLWQRSFFDHIIRSERALLKIREYIERNPGALYEAIKGSALRSARTLV